MTTHPCDRYLEERRRESLTTREQGNWFEDFCRFYLREAPYYSTHYEYVLTYADWAKSMGEPGGDRGIDLVAKISGKDEYAAIQCKFLGAESKVQKNEVDKFIAASPPKRFSQRVFIHTSDIEFPGKIPLIFAENDVVTIGPDKIRNLDIDWDRYRETGEVVRPAKKEMRDHQKTAVKKVVAGLKSADRGHVVMACGTGKTFVGLRIAEKIAGRGKAVLVLVPSLALMSQCVREWVNDADIPLYAIAVCSDAHVGKRVSRQSETGDSIALDLEFPSTTESKKVAFGINHAQGSPELRDRMIVVFSTYQSIDVISEAQKRKGGAAPDFDLVICDEAHRTTGATYHDKTESNFVKVHKDDFIRATKRLYMTATPRIYSENIKDIAGNLGVQLASMDDENTYGARLYELGFSSAVKLELLTDYKVIVLMLNEELVSASQQKKRTGDEGLLLDDGTKIIGCYKALTKKDVKNLAGDDSRPMKRALAFCNSIKGSKFMAHEFSNTVTRFLASDYGESYRDNALSCEIEHVDGTMNAGVRTRLLDWLKSDAGDDTSRILTNARCLGEGVDVPALDAVMFLHPRKSQIDVVQAVGRVMRKSPETDKKLGYVILPVGVPPGTTPEQILSHSKRFRVVWQILNALRSHDADLDAAINKGDLSQDIQEISNRIEFVGYEELSLMGAGGGTPETAVIHKLPGRSTGQRPVPDPPDPNGAGRQANFAFSVHSWSRAIMGVVVEKCGTREYWDAWARAVGENAQNHAKALTRKLSESDTEARAAFDKFLAELQDDLNETVSEEDAVEMLSQHTATKPVFQAIFEGDGFVSKNPVSVAMGRVLDKVNVEADGSASKDQEKFQQRIRRDLVGITDSGAKQRLIKKLYHKFFTEAFPRTVERLGIVYTPVEIVDFILCSVNEAMEEHFGESLGSRGVHIIDPFTGTGTFIARLLQLGLISPEEMKRKFNKEIHANEIVLLAYYVAAINIETVYRSVMEQAGIEVSDDEHVFSGICLTDTFQMYEKPDLISHYLPDNSERRTRQRELDIRVIVGNPPYSAGQRNQNDNNANTPYKTLHDRIRETYCKVEGAQLRSNQRNLFDSYVLAIRWASDRLGDAGIMSFVSNGGWIDGRSMGGLRKCLVEEFACLYVFNLRGDFRKFNESEGGNVFGSGAGTTIAIFLLVKNTESSVSGKIHYHDIGDALSTEAKLERIKNLGSIRGIGDVGGWEIIAPDEHNDWLNQRDTSFDRFIAIGDKANKGSNALFSQYTVGVITKRDAWCYNSSPLNLEKNVKRMIATYQRELDKVVRQGRTETDFSAINRNPTQIKWSPNLEAALKQGKSIKFGSGDMRLSLYRPFTKRWLYFSRSLNENVYQVPSMFPASSTKNLAFSVTGKGASAEFSVLMSDVMPNLHTMDSGQTFALWHSPKSAKSPGGGGGGGAIILKRRCVSTKRMHHYG